MKKSILAAVIAIVIAVIIAGSLYYYFYMYKPYKKTTTVVGRKALSLVNLLMKSVSKNVTNIYREYSGIKTSFILYVKKMKESLSGPSEIYFVENVYMKDVKWGLLKNKTGMIVYTYIGNLTAVINGKIIQNSKVQNVSGIMKCEDFKVLMVERINGSSEICISGIFTIVSGKFRNTTKMSKCVVYTPKIYGMQYVPLAFKVRSMEKLSKLIIKYITELFLKNVTYIGVREIGGAKCYLYNLNEIVDISKILSNKTLIRDIINDITKTLEMNISESRIESIMRTLASISIFLTMMGLDKWYVSSKFCITEGGRVLYMYLNVRNLNTGFFKVNVTMKEEVEGYKEYSNYVNTELLSELEGLEHLKKTEITPLEAVELSIPLYSSTEPLLSSVLLSEMMYIATTYTFKTSPPKVEAAKTCVVHVANVKLSESEIKFTLINNCTSPIRAISIAVTHDRKPVCIMVLFGFEIPTGDKVTVDCSVVSGKVTNCKVFGVEKYSVKILPIPPHKYCMLEKGYPVSIAVNYKTGKVSRIYLGVVS